MRPNRPTEVHNTQNLAELVCSNSFRSDDASANAVGVLHAEMRMLNSIIMSEAISRLFQRGIGRGQGYFSQGVEARLAAHPDITIERGEVSGLPDESWERVIVATGYFNIRCAGGGGARYYRRRGFSLF